MKYYLITNKEDDYGGCRCGVFYGKENDIKKHVYNCREIPKTHYEVLKKYFEDINDVIDEKWYIDFGYKNIKDYLDEYYG